RRDDRSRHEVVQEVGQDAELADVVGVEARPRRTEKGVDLVLAVDAFQLDAWTDEVIANHATGGPAGLRRDAKASDRRVQQPVHAAFRADIDTGRRRLRLGHDRQRDKRRGGQQSLFHDFPSFTDLTSVGGWTNHQLRRGLYTPQLVRRK